MIIDYGDLYVVVEKRPFYKFWASDKLVKIFNNNADCNQFMSEHPSYTVMTVDLNGLAEILYNRSSNFKWPNVERELND